MGSILLVEADTLTGEVWSAAIAAAGHAVVIARRMREALSVVRDGGIDLVVIDAYDPRIGVIELARGMTALPDTPPIILISESPAAPGVSVRIGAATFLPKPCEPDEVVAAIVWLLHGRALAFVDDEPTVRIRPRLAWSS